MEANKYFFIIIIIILCNPSLVYTFSLRSLAAARSGRPPAQFSQLLELAGVYKEGDRPPTTTAKSAAAKQTEAVFPQAEAAATTTTQATAEALEATTTERLTSYKKKAKEATTVTTTLRPSFSEKLQHGEGEEEARLDGGGGFMPRGLPFSPGYPRIPLPTPEALGFPGVESFLANFEKSVFWKEDEEERRLRRGRRGAEASLLGGGGHHHHHAGHGVSPNDLLPLPPAAPLLHIDHQVYTIH